VSQHEIYLEHRGAIERTLAAVCRRQRLSASDCDDFAATFRLRLVEDDYAVLKAFRGHSSLQTYLAVVVTRAFQDWRNARWGRWRPSAEARRLGDVAVRLETLIARDRMTLGEAIETLRTNRGVTESRAALETLAARLPQRASRQVISSTDLALDLPGTASADAGIVEQEEAAAARSAAGALGAAIAKLDPQDRLILKMRFDDDFSLADIARTLALDPRPLYRRVERLLQALRISLEGQGFTAAAAAEVLAARAGTARVE
jgi:RNA polymerase sigma factor (sigma-70 family)